MVLCLRVWHIAPEGIDSSCQMCGAEFCGFLQNGNPEIASAQKYSDFVEFQKGEMMKDAKRVESKRAVFIFAFTFILCVLVFWLGGCSSYDQLGETQAEGHRRHLRNLRVNRQELMADIDKAILLDKPSRLTDKRIP